MSKESDFIIFCIENYKVHKSMTGKEINRIFREYGVYDYLHEFYDVLHTVGYDYINHELDEYLSSQNAVLST